MRLDLDDGQREIEQAVRELFASRDVLARTREIADGDAPFDAPLWDELRALGWAGIAVPEAHGGMGLGMVELTLLLEGHGRACAATPLLGCALAGLALTQAGGDDQRQRWLGELAAGALSAFGFPDGGAESVLVGDAGDAGLAVLVDGDRGEGLLVERPVLTPAATIDPTRAYATLPGGAGAMLPGDIGAARDRMLVALAAEMVGLAQRALDVTVEYVRDRQQFGTPIGAFQSVAHLAAEMFRDVEAARSSTRAAAAAIDAERDDTAQLAAIAAACTADAAVNVTSTAIQLHGAVGFTWEADPHFLYKRAHVTARLIGGARPHRVRALREALARRRVPEPA